MVNQQLLDYIRQQLAGNIARETIRSNLISQGWLDQDIVEGFKVVEGSSKILTGIWAKRIPRINKVFMIIFLVLVFGLDLLILISSPSLAPYWYIMLGVLAIFAIFFYLENFIFCKRFAGTQSSLDKWISAIVVIRNIIFLLNFIPLIQLLGVLLLGSLFYFFSGLFSGVNELHGLGFGGVYGLIVPILFAVYIILIIKRYSIIRGH